MKRTVFVVLLVLMIVATPAFAERYWGARLGFNVASFTGDDADAADFGAETRSGRGGFLGGVFAEFRFLGLLGIRPELNVSGRGAVYEGGDTETKLRLQTVELPVLVEVFLPIPIPLAEISLFAGPAPAFVYATKYEYSEPGYSEEGDMEDNGITVSSFDLAVAAGLGVSLPAGPGRFMADVRYTAGLISVIDKIEVYEPAIDLLIVDNSPIIRTSTIGFYLAYGLAF